MNTFFKLSCVGVFLLSVAIPASAAPIGWSTEQLLSILIQNAASPLDRTPETRGCDSIWTDTQPKTLGHYLAFLTASLDPKNGQSGVTSHCKALNKKGDFQCDVMFMTGQGTESPWSYGVRFTIDKNGTLDPASLSCPGAS
jgi:hypothetical protein